MSTDDGNWLQANSVVFFHFMYCNF
jgi:hypothetical protein